MFIARTKSGHHEIILSLPGLWHAGQTSARRGSGGRGGSGALIWAGWASPQWAPPPAPSVWPGDVPQPARHAAYLQAVAYFSDRVKEWMQGEAGVGEIEMEKGDEDRGFTSAWAAIVRQGRVFRHGLIFSFEYPYLILLLIVHFLLNIQYSRLPLTYFFMFTMACK